MKENRERLIKTALEEHQTGFPERREILSKHDTKI